MKILIADDDPIFGAVLLELLNHLNHECTLVGDGESAWEYLVANGADVVVSDWQMPGMTGIDLCKRVRADAGIVYPYFILVSGRGDRHDTTTALRAGVDDHLVKPVNLEVMEDRLIVAARVRALHLGILRTRRELEAANARLDEIAHRDVLTGLNNRLRLREDLPGAHSRLERHGYGYHLALFDLDHFKDYNDTYGHQEGDALLAAVGRVMTEEIRSGDTAYRYGGEEFLLLMPSRNLDDAYKATERVRLRVSEVSHSISPGVPVTLSAGLAQAQSGESVDMVIKRADDALYRAKKEGRNRTVVDYGPSGEPDAPGAPQAALST